MNKIIKEKEIHEVHVIKEIELSEEELLESRYFTDLEVEHIFEDLQDALDNKTERKIYEIIKKSRKNFP